MNLKNRRAELGLTQKEVAEKSGLTLSYYQKLEYGSRSVYKLNVEAAVKLAEALRISITDLIE